jgi:hypothetical protein
MKLNGRKISDADATAYARLCNELEDARNAGDRDAVVKTSAALSALIAKIAPPKRSGFASRAGQRQAAERRALAAK